ncbi:MAG: hypothetical protein WA012_08145 [Rhodoferax sp.]|uniref:hypothetical protein n=1 Tax=Rhodoferax sp. TaxID=50421 RepID=UPI003BAF9F51
MEEFDQSLIVHRATCRQHLAAHDPALKVEVSSQALAPGPALLAAVGRRPAGQPGTGSRRTDTHGAGRCL